MNTNNILRKTFNLAVVAITLSFQVNGQTTLTAATTSPVSGDIFYYHHADTNSVSSGASGTGATWDFSTIHLTSTTDTFSFTNCNTTPYCDSFSGSNLAAKNNFGTYLYYSSSDSFFTYNGYETNTFQEKYTRGGVQIFYPMSYGSSRADSAISISHFIPYTSFVKNATYYDTISCDGIGTLITPASTYSNALRVHLVNVSNVQLSTSTTPVVTRNEWYTYYAPGVRFPIIQLAYDSAGVGVQTLKAVYYLTQLNASAVSDLPEHENKMTIFPNPTAHQNIRVVLFSAITDGASMQLLDPMGRTVISRTFKLTGGQNVMELETKDLSPGVYTVVAKDESGAAICHKRIVCE